MMKCLALLSPLMVTTVLGNSYCDNVHEGCVDVCQKNRQHCAEWTADNCPSKFNACVTSCDARRVNCAGGDGCVSKGEDTFVISQACSGLYGGSDLPGTYKRVQGATCAGPNWDATTSIYRRQMTNEGGSWYNYIFKHKSTGQWVILRQTKDCDSDEVALPARYYYFDGGSEPYVNTGSAIECLNETSISGGAEPVDKSQYTYTQFEACGGVGGSVDGSNRDDNTIDGTSGATKAWEGSFTVLVSFIYVLLAIWYVSNKT